MIVLALDTALNACSAAVLDGDQVLSQIQEPMVRGHQERLALMVQEAMGQTGLTFDDLDRIGVTVGPGSFTGLRVGMAFAKGLGLAVDRPVVGVTSLAALAASVDCQGLVAAVIDARRGQLYIQIFLDGRAIMAPDALSAETAAARLAELWRGGPAQIVGPGAQMLAGIILGAEINPLSAADPVALARLAMAAPLTPPRPLYLRAPDAKLPGGIIPPGFDQ